MFDALFGLFSPVSTAPRGVCVLPAPVAPKAKAAPAPKASSVFVENEETRTFGFRDDRETDRIGAVNGLTGWDHDALVERELWGGKKVITQNATAKKAWHDGKTVAECSNAMGLSESWVEKRFGAFSAALSQERAK